MKKITKLIIAVLAVYRLTQLVTEDEGPYNIFTRFRMFVGKNAYRSKHHKTFADGVNCPYCLGIWFSCIILLLPEKLRMILAISGGQSILQSLTHQEE